MEDEGKDCFQNVEKKMKRYLQEIIFYKIRELVWKLEND